MYCVQDGTVFELCRAQALSAASSIKGPIFSGWPPQVVRRYWTTHHWSCLELHRVYSLCASLETHEIHKDQNLFWSLTAFRAGLLSQDQLKTLMAYRVLSFCAAFCLRAVWRDGDRPVVLKLGRQWDRVGGRCLQVDVHPGKYPVAADLQRSNGLLWDIKRDGAVCDG